MTSSRPKGAATVSLTALAAALDQVVEAVILTDADGAVRFWNQAASALYGFAPHEVVGRQLDRLILPLGRQPAVRGLPGRDDTRTPPPRGDWLTRDRHGRRFWVSAATTVLPGETEHDRYTLTVITDTAAEKAAFQAAEWLASVVDTSSDAILTVDRSGLVTWANAATGAVLGWTAEELLGVHISALAPFEDQDGQREALAEVLAGRSVPPTTGERIRKDGSRVTVSVALSVMRDDRGAVTGASAVVRDMTSHVELQREVDRQSALFTALSLRSSDVAIVTDPEANILYVSPSVTAVFGYPATGATGLAAWGFVHRDDLPTVQEAVARVLSRPDGFERVTIRIQDQSGAWRWVEETITNLVSEPDIGGLVANLRDVTEQVQAQEELRRSEARYRAIAETAREGIAVIAPSGELLFANQMLADILGLPLPRVSDANVGSLLGEVTARGLTEGILELPYEHPDGAPRTLSVSATPLPLGEGGGIGTLAMVSDVTAARAAERELRRRALHDVLTDLPNRALLGDRLHMALARRRRGSVHPVALMFLDLDQFKAVNDSLGHDAGDLLLVEIGRRLQEAVRSEDTVARLGGDEFAVLCEDIDEADALLLAERLRSSVAKPIDLRGQRVLVDASIGIALSPPHDAPALLRSADAAMYQAKADGRGRTRVFDATVASSADRRLRVMSRLRELLTTGKGPELHYQPIVDLASGAVHGVEALLRWYDDELGHVTPLEVVAAAEATGLTYALDQWVLGRACSDLAGLRDRGVHRDIALSVNLSAQNIGATPLDELVAEVTRHSGWPADQLTLEVTESAIMTDPATAARLLDVLRRRGVSIAVDDFGTGYSSLAYLKKLPVSILKIDRSFVDQVTTDADSLAIVTSIVDLARGLGLRTIAEGIERLDQATAMQELGCAGGQGFLFSPAVPLEELAGLTRLAPGGYQRPCGSSKDPKTA
jgi:diguanylate cyclase (GGDEF)-like protein/PAS domain S-box-containing protein